MARLDSRWGDIMKSRSLNPSHIVQHVYWVVAFVMSMALSSCALFGIVAPKRAFRTIDLLLDQSELQPGLIVDYKANKSPWSQGTDDSAAIQLLFTNNRQDGNIQQAVYRYHYIDSAKSKYKDFATRPGQKPNGWTYHSLAANEADMNCYTWEGESIMRCAWTARYDEFLVEFNADLVPNRFSIQDFERAVRLIDAKMVKNLGK